MGKNEDRIQRMRSKQKQTTKVSTVRAQEGPPFNQKPIAAGLPKPPSTPPQPRQKKKPRNVPRLPDASVFSMFYDGEKVLWTGNLIIPGCPKFARDHGSVIGLLLKLDRMYRNWLREQEEGKKSE